MTWLTLLKGLLKLGLLIADIVRERQLLAAGEDRHLAKDLAAMAEALGIDRQVEEEMDKLTPAEVDEKLAEDDR